ncbi:hypothetical protein [Aeromonas phage 59.1]|nr:hypothetical protein [Aeromonas phage 59.1]
MDFGKRQMPSKNTGLKPFRFDNLLNCGCLFRIAEALRL